MAWLISTITGFVCSCGERFEGKAWLDHIQSHPSHHAVDYIYTNVPSIEQTIALIAIAMIITCLVTIIIHDYLIARDKSDALKNKSFEEIYYRDLPKDEDLIKYLMGKWGFDNKFDLAKALIYGENVEKDVEMGVFVLDTLAFSKKYGPVWFDAGNAYLKGDCVDVSREKALHCYKRAAQNGMKEAKEKIKELSKEEDM